MNHHAMAPLAVSALFVALAGFSRTAGAPSPAPAPWMAAAATDSYKLRPLYLTNTDESPLERPVCWYFENKTNLVISGGTVLYRGREVPFVFRNCRNVTLEDVTIDCAIPSILPCDITAVDSAARTVTFSVPASALAAVRARAAGAPSPAAPLDVVDDSPSRVPGVGPMRVRTGMGILFDGEGHPVFDTGDFTCIDFGKVAAVTGGVFAAAVSGGLGALKPGQQFAARPNNWWRPAAGIFVDGCENVRVRNVIMSSANGIGLLVQNTRNIAVKNLRVERSKLFPGRAFTLQADATHFANCSGQILVTDCLFEGQMDDAINVHGIYVRAKEQPAPAALVAEYRHYQSFGFEWAKPGERVRFIDSETLRPAAPDATVVEAALVGPKAVRLVFAAPVSFGAVPLDRVCLENLSRVPSRVLFARNICRDNRARGALFSSGASILVERNVFDHVSGAAIMVQGDANGWYESGALTNLVITGNIFRDCLTSHYGSCNAIITIDPVIRRRVPDTFFHSGVSITRNTFDVFEPAFLWAHDVDGLVFANNSVRRNRRYPPFLRPKSATTIRDCRNVVTDVR